MALVTCMDCGREVSTEALNCPGCGRPVQTREKIEGGAAGQPGLPTILGISGSIVLFLGVFAPIVSAPIVGTMNYFQNGTGDGVIVLLLAVGSVVFTLTRLFRPLWFTGGAALAVLGFTFVSFQTRMSEARQEIQLEMADNPFAGLGQMMLGTVQLQWGWAVLVIGAVVILAAAFLGSQQAS